MMISGIKNVGLCQGSGKNEPVLENFESVLVLAIIMYQVSSLISFAIQIRKLESSIS